jgi:hypothetical protein
MIIHNKLGGSNIVWDAESDAPLLIFKGGVFETDDSKVAEKAKKAGYEVEGIPSTVEKPKRGSKKEA